MHSLLSCTIFNSFVFRKSGADFALYELLFHYWSKHHKLSAPLPRLISQQVSTTIKQAIPLFKAY